MTEQPKTQPEDSLAWVADDPGVRKLLLTLWRRTRVDWSFASSSLADSFRKHKLGSRERRAVAECLYGMIRHHRRIDESLTAGGYRSGQQAPDEERILAYLVLEEGLSAIDAARHFPDLDWEQIANIDRVLDALPAGAGRLARRHSLPDWLAKRLVRDLGAEAEEVAQALSERAPMTVRANRLKTTASELSEALSSRGIRTHRSALAPDALIFDTRLNLFGLPEFKAGHFEAQDEGSQLIAELVMPPPKAVVADLCAGAGGKTLAVAASMGGKGRLVATDIYKRKLDELRKRCRRAGASNVQAVLIERDPKSPWPPAMGKWVGKMDRVLIDAPCSGIGSLRRNPELRWRLTADEADRLPAEQLAICERALSLLAPGGRLIYATCTVLRDENEGVVARLLERHSELELVPCKEVWGSERAMAVGDGQYLRTLPSRHGCDGFFAAIVRRKR